MFKEQHYKAIAEILKYSKTKKEIIEALANYFFVNNSRFNDKKFKEACEYTQ